MYMMCMEDHMYIRFFGGPHVHDVYGGPHIHVYGGPYAHDVYGGPHVL